jgi:hypothetical protein
MWADTALCRIPLIGGQASDEAYQARRAGICNGYWFLGRPRLEISARTYAPLLRNAGQTGTSQRRNSEQRGSKPQGTFLSIWQNVRPNSRRAGLGKHTVCPPVAELCRNEYRDRGQILRGIHKPSMNLATNSAVEGIPDSGPDARSPDDESLSLPEIPGGR